MCTGAYANALAFEKRLVGAAALCCALQAYLFFFMDAHSQWTPVVFVYFCTTWYSAVYMKRLEQGSARLENTLKEMSNQ